MRSPFQLHLETPTKAQKIDRFGDLYWQIESIKPEYDDLRKEIAGWYDQTPADKPASEAGVSFILQVSAREKRRTIFNKLKAFTILRKLLGLKALVELLTIPLEAAVDKHVDAAQHKLFLVQARTGPRKLVPVPIATPAAAKAA